MFHFYTTTYFINDLLCFFRYYFFTLKTSYSSNIKKIESSILTAQVSFDYVYQVNLILDCFNNKSKSSFIFTRIGLDSKHLQKHITRRHCIKKSLFTYQSTVPCAVNQF